MKDKLARFGLWLADKAVDVCLGLGGLAMIKSAWDWFCNAVPRTALLAFGLGLLISAALSRLREFLGQRRPLGYRALRLVRGAQSSAWQRLGGGPVNRTLLSFHGYATNTCAVPLVVTVCYIQVGRVRHRGVLHVGMAAAGGQQGAFPILPNNLPQAVSTMVMTEHDIGRDDHSIFGTVIVVDQFGNEHRLPAVEFVDRVAPARRAAAAQPAPAAGPQ